ncbi:MAG: valine--tRNA ligase [Alphaproteobacteria bacterium]|nr:MAG: valine--tRNA ligase [Alphaproteobacteria bacterium]
MLDKTYDAASIEPRIARRWQEANAFRAGAGARPGARPYAIVIPPPNVTGSLHMGHALNNTLQDVLVRHQRMRGRDVLWQPGLDHAGIATQMVVERQLMERQEPDRRALGRDKFIERVWQWKEESGGLILNQLKRLGASCDWSRERFTMDDGLSTAVVEVFVRLYKEGLIHKDKRLVNWDPKLLTAISDLEVEQIETRGSLWHFRYPLADGVTYEHPFVIGEDGARRDWKPSDGAPAGHETRDYIVVATTRPETMLGDTGVAVHPEDPRYRALVGKFAVLPPVGRRLPIVADEYPDPEAGTGAVKMTPAHDFNDFEVGKRRKLPAINVLAPDASIAILGNEEFLAEAEATPARQALWEALNGLDRFAARERIVAFMEQEGCLDRVEAHTHMVPHGDRGGVPIEPFLTDQWYVDAATLARPAIASVREGRTRFVPKNWENTYFNWMENIQPWCISRQLWWGHQIPAWYGPDGTIFVERTEEEALEAAIQHYMAHEGPWKAWVQDKLEDFRPGEIIERDEDVLDTWFSSALWPFSTLGWPDETPELARYYPTDVLVTGFDIIFFWVARMMMMGLHFTRNEAGEPQEPFHTVYVHALVRDKFGQKMSKSKGNVVDPLELIDEYGADALRFTLAILAAQGRDVKLDPSRVAGYRNFGTKLWNAARFALINGARRDPGFEAGDARLTINRWILTELSRTVTEVTEGIEKFRFNDAAGAIYRFVWSSFCDWYVELLKPVFAGKDEGAKAEARACAAHVLDETCKLLHPFMPFLTEELWLRTGEEAGGRATLICHAPWPEADVSDAAAAAEVNWLIELVSEVRSVRAEMNIKPSQVMPLAVVDANEETRRRLAIHAPAIHRLARVDPVELAERAPASSAQIVIGEATACLPLEGIIDFAAERARLRREVARLEGEIRRLEGKLGNEKFVANAPVEVVEEERDKLAGYRDQLSRTARALKRVTA